MPAAPQSSSTSRTSSNGVRTSNPNLKTLSRTQSASSSPLFFHDEDDDRENNDENHRPSNSNNNSNNTTANETSEQHATGSGSGAMRPHYKEGIRLAEMGKWGTLVGRLEKEPQLARHKDHHGMLPLHWACTEDDVPPSVIKALLKASPEGVLTKNNAQYLPIHIAVRARAGEETLRLLCQARPSSLLEGTPSGKTALVLAKEVNLPAQSMEVLRQAEQEYLDLTEERESTNNNYEDTKREIAMQSQRLRESMMMVPQPPAPQQQQQPASLQPPVQRSFSNGGRRNTTSMSTTSSLRGTTHISVGNGNSADDTPGFGLNENPNSTAAGSVSNSNAGYFGEHQQQQHPSTSMSFHSAPHPMTATTGPTVDNHEAEHRRSSRVHNHDQPLTPSMYENEGNSGVCGVCYKKFSMFRKKYQCKGCAVYLCKKHVAGKVMLPNYPKKRSACGDCYRIYRSDPMPLGGTIGTAPAAAGRAPSFTSSTTTGTTVTVSQRNGGDQRDRNSSLYGSNSVSSSVTTDRRDRAASTQSLLGRPSTVVGPQTNLRYSVNSGSARPRNGNTSLFSTRTSSTLDRYGSDTTVSLTESDPITTAEVVVLQNRVAALEDQNKSLLTRLADQEKQYNEAMLLLTETMTRVAEIEMKIPSMGLKHTFGTSTTSENRESNILGDYDFDFPTPFNEKFD